MIKLRKEMEDIYSTRSIIVVSPRKRDRTAESAERHPRRQMESGQREMRVILIWLGPYIRVGIGGMLGSKLFTKGSSPPPSLSFPSASSMVSVLCRRGSRMLLRGTAATILRNWILAVNSLPLKGRAVPLTRPIRG